MREIIVEHGTFIYPAALAFYSFFYAMYLFVTIFESVSDDTRWLFATKSLRLFFLMLCAYAGIAMVGTAYTVAPILLPITIFFIIDTALVLRYRMQKKSP